MHIKIIGYSKKNFLVEDLLNNVQFKIHEKTLISLLKLNHNVLCPALVDRKYIITTTASEV